MAISQKLVTLSEFDNLSDDECNLLARILNMLADCLTSERGKVIIEVSKGKITKEAWEYFEGRNGEKVTIKGENGNAVIFDP